MIQANKSVPGVEKMLQQGLALHQQGLLEEAKGIYQQIIKSQPKNFDALKLWGAIALQQKNYEECVKLLTKALKIKTSYAPTYFNLGISLQALKRLSAAVISYEKAIKLKSNYSHAYNGLASALKELNHFEAAVENYDKAINLDPNYTEAYTNRGVALQELKLFDAAIDSYNKAISINPNYIIAHINRGNALQELKLFDAAIDSFKKAININSESAEAYNGLGKSFKELGDFDAAIANYHKAININPDYIAAYIHRGNALQALKKVDASIANAAMANYDKAITIDPNCANAYWNKSLLKLLLGEYEEGWALYEWRWKGFGQKFFRRFKEPLWLGNEPIKDKTILIHSEQGLGDIIQFSRYIPMVQALGPKQIIVEVPKALLSLISTINSNFKLIEMGKSIPRYDLQCPIMSLPHAFKTTVDNIPAVIPYLFVDNNKKEYWRKRLGIKKKSRIGFVWSGSSTHKNDHHRSLLFKQLEPLFDLPFEFHSLQKEIRPVDLEALNKAKKIQQHQELLVDFTDTAALIEHLDLVISVDTSIVHLAGAMGKQVFILLPFAPDYRWMLERNDSQWYPTATLFRQPELDDWNNVIQKVKLALINFIEC